MDNQDGKPIIEADIDDPIMKAINQSGASSSPQSQSSKDNARINEILAEGDMTQSGEQCIDKRSLFYKIYGEQYPNAVSGEEKKDTEEKRSNGK